MIRAAELTAAAREALRRAVLSHETTSGGAGPEQRNNNVRALWPALIAGQWSLVDAFIAKTTRYVVARENPAELAAPRALTEREQCVLELALAGRAGKWIAYELDVSESAVTRALRSALHRLGARDTAALAGVRAARFAPLDGDGVGLALGTGAGHGLALARCPAAAIVACLSEAEHAVVSGMREGESIAAIARDRGTSSRTVSHQIASAYRKLGVSSRRELLALLT
jgi:DNA-binding NarL/FixJ family response regulator